MYIADDKLVICCDNLIGVEKEDRTISTLYLKYIYPDKTIERCFYNKESERDAMFDFIVKRLCDDRFILQETEKVEPIDKEKIGKLIKNAINATFKNGMSVSDLTTSFSTGQRGTYDEMIATSRQRETAMDELYDALGIEREYWYIS